MTQYPNPHKVELLAPAGSAEALTGAFSAGADAVYLGGERFGARAYADNFSTEEIIRSIAQAHVLDRKVYLTANVLTREDELEELVAFVSKLDEAGLDGVIVQDIGVLEALHEACPDLPLHASTQMSVSSSDAVHLLRGLGVSRVVPARELSLKEIATLRAEDAAAWEEPIEIEAFIHGAMCYSYSGRCLMSSFLGGRSGNRGRCAGTCRLPYRILDEKRKPAGPDAKKKEIYPLSMKDMCVLSILPELIDAGIDSFKIEGRMKKPVYAAGVTAIYRKYIDRCYAWMEAGRPTPWKVEEDDLDMLRSLYIRTELGTGYYHAKNGRNLVTIGKPGYAGTDAALEEQIRRQYLGRLPARAITGKAVFRTGMPALLSVTFAGNDRQTGSCGEDRGLIWVRAEGALVQTATGRPMSAEDLKTRLCKTGDSMFTFSDLEIEADDNIFLPVSAVNTLRREALAELQEKILQAAKGKRHQKALQMQNQQVQDQQIRGQQEQDQQTRGQQEQDQQTREQQEQNQQSRGQEVWALVSTRAQMEAAASAGCTCILVDGDFDPADSCRGASAKSAGAKTSSRADSDGKTQKRNNPGVKSLQNGDIVSGKIRYICVLPPVFRVNNRDRIRRAVLSASEKGYSGILVRTLEELSLVLETGYEGEIIADASLYSWNGRSLSFLASKCSRIVCPLELNQNGLRAAIEAAGKENPDAMSALMDRMILPVYGRIPMMESAGCVRKTENMCTHNDGFWYLEDRRGMQLPVRCRCGTCSNTIYNAVPLSLHRFAGRGLCRELPVHLCMFTTEDAEQTSKILQFFDMLQNRDGFSAKKRGSGGAKNFRPPFEQFTNGHYKTGAI